ncbi:MAG: tetratricopeptide repeat protein, partial [Chitinivibrionales bacterium]|nr:tetratricopeptide repeat protein [Chitinivibrionales bacterium]MBD3394473.1 tetratricopeptide repeat protein [Chitinivibrionales bacterium]
YRLGVKYKNENKLEQAIEEFRKVLAAYPDNYNAYMHIAQIREKQGKPRLAIYNLKKALAYNPGWGKAHRMLARVYESDKQIQNAIKELQLYQQVCDPEERDSVQAQLDRLTGSLGAPGAGTGAVATATAAPAGGKQASAPAKRSRKASAATTRPIKAGPEAEREFKHGVAAYQEAVQTGDPAGFDRAIAHFRKTLEYHPGHAGAYYYAGLIRRRKGQNQMAKVNFSKAVTYPELGYNAHFYLGKIHGEEKEYEEAIRHLKAYMQKTSYEAGRREAQALIDRFQSALQAQRGDTVEVDIAAVAEAELHREVSDVPPEVPLAPMEVRIDSLLSMAIVDTLTDPGQAMLKGVRMFRDGSYDAAIETFKEVLVSYPRGNIAACAIYNIGICYLKLKVRDYRSAENQFQQVIERYPSHPLASKSTFLKAVCYYERKESELAERLLRQFIQKYRTHAWVGKAYEKLGDAYTDLEKHRKAVDAYSQAASGAANDVDKVYAFYKLGTAYFRIDNPARAVQSFEKAIAAGEKNNIRERVPDSYYKIADYYYKQKEYDRALDYYKRATRGHEWYHDTPWGLFQIGNIYKHQKKYELAAKTYKKLMEAYPGHYWAGQAQWKMEDAVWENEYRAVLR